MLQLIISQNKNRGNQIAPIREKNKIKEIKAILLKSNYRDYVLFTLTVKEALLIMDNEKPPMILIFI